MNLFKKLWLHECLIQTLVVHACMYASPNTFIRIPVSHTHKNWFAKHVFQSPSFLLVYLVFPDKVIRVNGYSGLNSQLPSPFVVVTEG